MPVALLHRAQRATPKLLPRTTLPGEGTGEYAWEIGRAARARRGIGVNTKPRTALAVRGDLQRGANVLRA